MRSFAAVLVLLAACSGEDDTGEEIVDCDKVTDKDEFVVGLTKPGMNNVLEFVWMSATPSPPARYDNEWVIQVHSLASGSAPVASADIVVTPFMPKHNHGTPIQTVVTPTATTGEYKLARVNLSMPDVWEVTVDVLSASGDDSVIYKICIPRG